MQTSFHHQPEAQHPNFQLSTSWQADYPILWHETVVLCVPANVCSWEKSGHAAHITAMTDPMSDIGHIEMPQRSRETASTRGGALRRASASKFGSRQWVRRRPELWSLSFRAMILVPLSASTAALDLYVAWSRETQITGCR